MVQIMGTSTCEDIHSSNMKSLKVAKVEPQSRLRKIPKKCGEGDKRAQSPLVPMPIGLVCMSPLCRRRSGSLCG